MGRCQRIRHGERHLFLYTGKMETFGDEFSAVSEVDPAADFLAREQDQLAGLEGEILAEPEAPSVQEVQDDFMTDTFDAVSSNPLKEEAVNYDADTFGSALDDGLGGESVLAPEPEAVKPELVQPAAPNYSLPREEPEKILKWREEQKLRLEQKDEEEEKKKKEMKEQASKELEEWYLQHKETIEKTRLANRNAEKELATQSEEVEPGQEWERIAKLCDFNPKASRNNKDVSRMRSIILQLKQSPPVCATGQ